MLVGNPFSDMNLEKAVYWKILRNQLTVTGTWNSSFSFMEKEFRQGFYGTDGVFSEKAGMPDTHRPTLDNTKEKCLQDDWQYVLERLTWKRIDPACLITHRFPLDELEQGFHIMRDKTEDYIKIMGIIKN